MKQKHYKFKVVDSKADFPKNDDWHDYPIEYIVRCFDDNSRGNPHIFSLTASQFGEYFNAYDRIEYLIEA